MKNYILYYIFIVVLVVTSSFSLGAQSVKQLEKERKETLKKMETTNKMLNETKKSQQSSLNKLKILTNNIVEQKKLINTINKEVDKLSVEIQQLNTEQQRLEKRLEALKADYAKLVQEAHINRDANNKIMFVLSANSFDQSFRRLRYMHEYSAYRKEQAKEIERVKTDIQLKNKQAEEHRVSKLAVLQEKESETKKLATNQEEEKKMLTDLQKKEKALKEQLKAQEKKAAQLNKKIEDVIAAEIKRNEEKRKKAQQKEEKGQKGQKQTTTPEAKTVNPENNLTKEEKLLNGNFEANKGRLPWPIERGFISGRYGVQPHPVLKYVTINNKGIYLQTPVGSEARAVFDGEVTGIFSVPGSNNGVIVKHGNYRTVYANLTEIFVKEGDKIKAKQRIGKIYTDDENENKTELYFQLRKGKDLMNPEPWVTR